MNTKKRFLLYLFLIFISVPLMGQTTQKVFKVVIDAGHGGDDPGCNGARLKEKNINLSSALKAGKLISENCPAVQVIYTRSTDVFVELYRRAQIANDNHADLFISFHCNASPSHVACGIETYVMGLHKTEANQAVARAENSAMLKEKNYENNYEGFNPDSPEANVLFSLYSSGYLKNSILLADKVQKNLVSYTHLDNREVKQAGFWVLYKVAMPSILIEQGFLTNQSDEGFLGNSTNQDIVATAVYNAFVDYLAVVKGIQYTHIQPSIPTKPPVTETHATPTPKDTTTHPASVTSSHGSTSTQTLQNSSDTSMSRSDNDANDIRFRIQFLATPEKIPLSDRQFKGLPKVSRFQENNLWKYTAGNEATHEDAVAILKEIQKTHKDAFIIAFQGDKKISEKEAIKLLKK